jgi:RNA polymerase sigma-70 factor (ECF subfamily)
MRRMLASLTYPEPGALPRTRPRALGVVRASEVSMQEPSDEQLMGRVVARDHAAFGVLVGRHLRRAVCLAQSVLGSAADADEVAQDVFVKLWERPSLFEAGKARFTTWLHRVVVNQCIDRRRTRRFEPLDVVMEQASDEPAPVELLHTEQTSQAVGHALNALPVRQRTALALFYLHGLPQREAASHMDLSDSAFESLLHRARSALGTALASMNPFREKTHDTK